MLQPITRRQYAKFRKKPHLKAELRYCIKWWIAALANPISRVTPITPRPAISIYSEADGNGHLGVFIAHDNSYSYAHALTPAWITKLYLQIYELETCAILLAITITAQMAENATIVLFVVNTGAQNARADGTAAEQVANQTVATFWQVAFRSNISVEGERADSPENISDSLSRKCGTGGSTNPFIGKENVYRYRIYLYKSPKRQTRYGPRSTTSHRPKASTYLRPLFE